MRLQPRIDRLVPRPPAGHHVLRKRARTAASRRKRDLRRPVLPVGLHPPLGGDARALDCGATSGHTSRWDPDCHHTWACVPAPAHRPGAGPLRRG